MQDRDVASLASNPFVRAVLAAVLLAALAAVFIAVRAGEGDDGPELVAPPTGVASPEPDDARGALTDDGPVVGRPAPDFELSTADGELVRLSDLRGKVVFINFWATWCRPCKQELPDIEKLYEEKQSEGLEVIAINYEDSRADAVAYFTDGQLDMPMLLDRNGSVYDQYRLQGLPDSFFVDRDGNLAALHYGFMSEEKMRQRLEQAGLP
jgi:peroxiredoxin